MNRWTTTAYRSATHSRFCFINVFDRRTPLLTRLAHRRRPAARFRAVGKRAAPHGMGNEDQMYRRIGDVIYEQQGRETKFVAKRVKGSWYRLATNKLGQPEWECCDPNQCAMFDELTAETSDR